MTSPAIAEIRRLERLGFQRIPLLDVDGELDVTVFVRDTADWQEVVLVYSEQRARGWRTRPVDPAASPLSRPTSPITLLPLTGVVSTVHAVLSLPSQTVEAQQDGEG